LKFAAENNNICPSPLPPKERAGESNNRNIKNVPQTIIIIITNDLI
jgi:hypothetical protein